MPSTASLVDIYRSVKKGENVASDCFRLNFSCMVFDGFFLFLTIWTNTVNFEANFALIYLQSLKLLCTFLGQTVLDGVLPLCDASVGRRVVHSSRNWGTSASWERFDLESPNFSRTFMPLGSTTTLDMTSLATSTQKLSHKPGFDYDAVIHLRRLWVKF